MNIEAQISRAGVDLELQMQMRSMGAALARKRFGASFGDLVQAVLTGTQDEIFLNLPAIGYARFKRLFNKVKAEQRKETHI